MAPRPRVAVLQHALEVLRADAAPAGEPTPRTPKHRRRVPHPARLEIAAEPLQLRRGVAQRDHQVHALLGPEVVGSERAPRHLGEALAKRVEPIPADREPGGHVVAAVALQQVAALGEGRVQIEA